MCYFHYNYNVLDSDIFVQFSDLLMVIASFRILVLYPLSQISLFRLLYSVDFQVNLMLTAYLVLLLIFVLIVNLYLFGRLLVLMLMTGFSIG